MDNEGGARARRPPHRARVARDVRLFPQPGIDGQDGRHARRPFRAAGSSSASGRAGTSPSTTRSATRSTIGSGGSPRTSRSRVACCAASASRSRGAGGRCTMSSSSRHPTEPCRSSWRPRDPACSGSRRPGRTPGTRPGSAAPTSGCARGSRSSTRHATRVGRDRTTLRRTVGIRLADPDDGTADATTLQHRRRWAGIDLRRARGTRPRRHDRVVPVQVGRRAGPHRRGTSPPPRGAMTSRSATMPR